MRGDQAARILKVTQLLSAQPDGLTVAELSGRMGCSLRTAYRDLHVLEQAGFPLYQEEAGDGIHWRFVDGFRHRVTVPFTVPELFALHVACKALPGSAGLAVAGHLSSAFSKIKSTLHNGRIEELRKGEGTVTVDSGPVRQEVKVDLLETIRRAVLDQETLALVYRAPSRRRPTHRKVDPLRLHIARGSVYLVAFCHLRRKVRRFLLDRIRVAVPTGRHFVAGHDEEASFEGAFSTFGGRAQDVELVFAPEAAPYVRERVWHRTQVLEELKGGRVRMRLKVFPGPDLESWVRSWGSKVEAVAPRGLRKRLFAELRRTLAIYLEGQGRRSPLLRRVASSPTGCSRPASRGRRKQQRKPMRILKSRD